MNPLDENKTPASAMAMPCRTVRQGDDPDHTLAIGIVAGEVVIDLAFERAVRQTRLRMVVRELVRDELYDETNLDLIVSRELHELSADQCRALLKLHALLWPRVIARIRRRTEGEAA